MKATGAGASGRGWTGRRARNWRASQVDAALELLEPGRIARRVERHDLAVEDHWRASRRAAHCRSAVDDLGELAGLFVAQARPQRAPVSPGAISAIARMPSYFGSYTSSGSASGASASDASMGCSIATR